MKKIGIIGGTGVYDPAILQDPREVEITTPYGAVTITEAKLDGEDLVFMNRHGRGHSIPPHKINYRANIWALKEAGVTRILATAAVGSMNEKMAPGNFIFPDQFLEFTKARACTFFDGGKNGVVHTDMTEPYCPQLRRCLEEAAKKISITFHSGGTYVTTEGPRFETPAEILMYRQFGGDLVGMTAYPEVALAGELGLRYATVAMVTNYAAGVAKYHLSHKEVLDTMEENSYKVRDLLLTAVPLIAGMEEKCNCDEEDALR